MIYCYSYTHTHTHTHTHLKHVLSINRFVVDVRSWMMHIHECEYMWTDIHLPAPPNCSTIRAYLSRIQTHVVTTDSTQRFSSIGGVVKGSVCAQAPTVCTGAYCDWVYTTKGASIPRLQPQLPLHNCQVTRFTHKEPRAWIFMWKFLYF